MNGERNGEPIFCPVNGWDCPYWRENGKCVIDNPMEDTIKTLKER